MGYEGRNCCEASRDGALHDERSQDCYRPAAGRSIKKGSSSIPIMVGFVQPQYDLSLKLSGTTPPLEGPQMPSTVSEAYRVTNQFYEDFCVLKAQVDILEAENQAL